jgi:riboflavin synthase
VQNTALHALTPGAHVNLEIDTVARYVERMLSHMNPLPNCI